jgi:hypothetical protein
MSSVIYYYIPEDKEEPDKLNAFVISKDIETIRINDVKDSFPLPGEYYFRFKFKFQNKNVWIDFNNADAILPRFEGKIIMKVTRISWDKHELLNEQKQNLGDIFK